MVKRLLIAVVLLALVGGGLIGFNLFRDRMIAEVFASMPQPALAVSTVTAERGTWQPAIEAIGTVNASQGVELTVEAAGIVREIAFASNQQVSQGDLLLRLDDTVQSADLEAAETQLGLDQVNLERARELRERGVTASVSLDEAQAAFQVSEAQVARARAVLDQRQLAAPFDGTIGLPRIDIGEYLAPGTVVATLQDLRTMRVDFTLPEQRLPEVFIGQPLAVRDEEGGARFSGEITGIDPRVDPASRLFAVRGTVENADESFIPGQFVRLEIALPEEDGVIALPQTTIVSSLYGDHVFVVRPREGDGETLEARQVFVTVGRRFEGLVEVAAGVEAGDVVVSAGQNRLSSGMPVTVEAEAGPTEATAAAQETQLR